MDLRELLSVAAIRVELAEARRRPLVECVATQVAVRAAQVAASPLDRRWPLWRLQEAWLVWRHGALFAGEWHAGAAGPVSAEDLARLLRAGRRYEENAASRPAGWPATAYGALQRIGADARELGRRPQILAYAIIELDQLSRRNRASASADAPKRLAKLVRRARRRRYPPQQPATHLAARAAGWTPWPRWVTLGDDARPLLVDGELVVRDAYRAPAGYEHQPWAAPGCEDPAYLAVLRDAHLVAGLWPPPHADGRSAMAYGDDRDVELARRRARPGPYAPPEHRRARVDPADLELAFRSGMALHAARRLDVDERDRRLAHLRSDQATIEHYEREAFWRRIRAVSDPDLRP